MTEAPDPGPVPELAWLPVEKIRVDHSYQRTIASRASQKLIERIAGDFQWCAFQAILACEAEGGGWLVLDGQHRVEAARQAGIAHVPAVVVEAGNVAQQALAFVRANLDRVGLSQYALFYAKITAEDPHAIAVKRVVDAAGIEIPRYSIPLINLKPGQTLALGGISKLVEERGEAFATQLLTVIAKACSGTRGSIKASLLRACAKVIEGDATRLEALGRILGHGAIEKFLGFCAARRRRDGSNETQSIEDELRSRLRAAGVTVVAPASPAAAPVAQPRPMAAPPRPAPVSIIHRAEEKPKPSRAAEIAAQEAFIARQGVARIAGEVKTVATNEQALEALKEIGVKAIIGNAYTVVHGQRIKTGDLVDFTNRLLAQRQIVRVKPGEKVPA